MIRSVIPLVVVALSWAPVAEAQRDTPCHDREASASSTRIAGADEPGERLVITGTVVVGEERTPVSGARVLAFHTDAGGYYSKGGMDEGNARLCGVLVTDAEGRYRIESIRPAHYATGGPPAHVHFEVTVPGRDRERFTLNFEGDPLLRGAAAGELWERVRPVVQQEDGVSVVERDFWIR